VQWPTGSVDEKYTLTRKEGTPETIQAICIATVCCAIALTMVGVTCDCFFRERKAAKIAHAKINASLGIEGQSNFDDENDG